MPDTIRGGVFSSPFSEPAVAIRKSVPAQPADTRHSQHARPALRGTRSYSPSDTHRNTSPAPHCRHMSLATHLTPRSAIHVPIPPPTISATPLPHRTAGTRHSQDAPRTPLPRLPSHSGNAPPFFAHALDNPCTLRPAQTCRPQPFAPPQRMPGSPPKLPDRTNPLQTNPLQTKTPRMDSSAGLHTPHLRTLSSEIHSPRLLQPVFEYQ